MQWFGGATLHIIRWQCYHDWKKIFDALRAVEEARAEFEA